MSNKWATLLLIGLLGLCFQSSALGMGLRSFVALPVEKGGTVLRGIVSHDNETNINQLTANLAYGIDRKKNAANRCSLSPVIWKYWTVWGL